MESTLAYIYFFCYPTLALYEQSNWRCDRGHLSIRL